MKKSAAPRRGDNKHHMVTITEVIVRDKETVWHVSVTPRIQRLIERIGVYHDQSTHEVLSNLIRDAIEQREKQVFFAKVDERIDAALQQIDHLGVE